MTTSAIHSTLRRLLLTLATGLALCATLPAQADSEAAGQQVTRQQSQPLNNAPVWRDVRSGEAQTTVTRGPETGVLIQTEGMTWRALRNGPVTMVGGTLVLLVAAAILGFYFIKGPLTLHEAPTGRTIERFNLFERIVHWGTAISFVILAVSGLGLLFGKYVVVPVLGHSLFALFMSLGKTLHNYVGPIFLGFTLVMIVMWARDNLWQAWDALWIRKAGGLLSGEHVPSGRFNFGEKSWFWLGVTVLGLIVAGSGLVVDFPNFGQTRATLQTFNLIHAVAAIVLMLLSFGHIYMGTIGVIGAYASMRSGQVDETWAKEHHRHWYDGIKSGKLGQPETR